MSVLVPVLIPVRPDGPGAAAAARGRGSRRAPFNGRGEELGAFKKGGGWGGRTGNEGGKSGTDEKPGSGQTRTRGRPAAKPGWREENRD